MSQVQQQFKKVFNCMNCGVQIKLTRKPDNSGWNRYELDGTTLHKCQKKEREQTTTTTRSVNDRLDAIDHKLDTLQKTMELILKK